MGRVEGQRVSWVWSVLLCHSGGVSGADGAGLVLLGSLYGEKRVHDGSLSLWVAGGLLLTVLLSPCLRPGWGAQAASPGQRVQT